MAHFAPPYLGKQIEELENEVLWAQKQELKAKKKLEFAEEYRKLCEEKLENAKKQEEE